MENNGRILVIDDDPYILLSLQTLLEQHFTYVKTLSDPDLIPAALKEDSFNVVLLDMNYIPGETSGREGLKWLKKLVEKDPFLNVIVITAYGGIQTAVKAMKAGAVDFIIKPWQNERIISTVSAALKLSQSNKKVALMKGRQDALSLSIENDYPEIIGQSDAIKKVLNEVGKVAVTEANILILGENGTGKELVARELHRRSSRSKEIFISTDLGALSENLFESELFGHVKGSFTDAKYDRIGRFEAATGGTLFLDEIGNLPLPLQSKLLSVLEKREVLPLGSNKAVKVDIRLICATNLDLNGMAREGSFRLDLLYRINTIEITLPALRDRQDDIPLLAGFFLNKFSRKYHKPELKLSGQVMKKLQKLDWPGNIRELQHVIERAVILSDGTTISRDDFNFSTFDREDDFKKDNYNLEELERWAVQNCLKKYDGNITRAAGELGLTRGAMYRRISKYGL